jgi:hypothetical protein
MHATRGLSQMCSNARALAVMTRLVRHGFREHVDARLLSSCAGKGSLVWGICSCQSTSRHSRARTLTGSCRRYCSSIFGMVFDAALRLDRASQDAAHAGSDPSRHDVSEACQHLIAVFNQSCRSRQTIGSSSIIRGIEEDSKSALHLDPCAR